MLKILIILVYVAVIVGLSIYASRQTKTVDDFVLGNRSIGPWMSAFTYGATYFSAVLIIGFAGKVGWGFGLSALLIAFGNAIIGTYMAWKVLGYRTREITSRLNVLTLPSFLEARFDSTRMKVFACLIIFIFFVPYSASVFMGLSYLFESIFNIPYMAALLFMTIVAALYLVLGGYRAISMIDFVQGLVMLTGIILMVYFVVGHKVVDGFANAYRSLMSISPDYIYPGDWKAWIALTSVIILTSLGTWGLPQMVQKFYGIRSTAVIHQATIVSTIFALVITTGAYYVGSLSHLFFDELPKLNGQATPDLIMPNIISQTLPELVAVLILVLVLSASMSTLSSLVLVSSSSVSIDLIKGALFPELNPRVVIKIMRVLCVVFIGLSLWIAIKPPDVILTLMSLSWGTVAGAFLAPYIFGLFWPRTTRAGAWTGMITGLIVSLGGYAVLIVKPAFISQATMNLLSSWGTPFFGSLAMIIPLIVVPAVSLITKQYPESHLRKIYASGRQVN
ncbi:MAG: sodium:solute symporter family protein [Syntrophomonadaceae bacterium]